MHRSHNRKTYPLDKSPDKAIKPTLRQVVKFAGDGTPEVTVAERNNRSMSRAGQGISHTQAKKRRQARIDLSGHTIDAGVREGMAASQASYGDADFDSAACSQA